MSLFKSYKKYNDEELMKFVQGHNYSAFDELHTRYSKRLLHFMFKMLNNDEEKAQDLLQDLFMKIVERPHMFDTSKKFYSWVFTIAANMCRTHYRDLKKNEISMDEDAARHLINEKDELFSKMDGKLFSTNLELALGNLQYEQKETFILRFQEGFSIEEISVMMNCSLGTVKSRIYYTTRKLAIELQEFKSLLNK